MPRAPGSCHGLHLVLVTLWVPAACNGSGGHGADADAEIEAEIPTDFEEEAGEMDLDVAHEDPEDEEGDMALPDAEDAEDQDDDGGGGPCSEDAVNVRMNGAAGDGVTDDTAAIQALIDDAANAELFFPAGTYRISRQAEEWWALRISRDGLTLCGEGAASVLKMADPGSADHWLRAVRVTGDDVSLINLTLDGSRIAGTGWEYEQEHGVFVHDEASRFNARGLEIHDFQGDGIFLYRAQEATIQDCFVHDCWRAGINLEVGTVTECFDNTIHHCNSGIHIEMDTDGTVNADTHIHHNTITPLQPDTGEGGIGIDLLGRPDGLLRTLVELNTIDHGDAVLPVYAAIICGLTTDMVIRNNTIRGAVDPDHGIITAWFGNGNLTIESNTLEECAYVAPVHCGGATVSTPNDGIEVHDNLARNTCTWSSPGYGETFDNGFVWVTGAAPTTNLDAHGNVFEP